MSRTLEAITSPRSLASGKVDNQTMKAVRIHKYGGQKFCSPRICRGRRSPRRPKC
jgi:hypothetical protein